MTDRDADEVPPPWPAWLGFVAFLVTVTFVLTAISAIDALAPGDVDTGAVREEVALLGTFIQDLALIAGAVLFSAIYARPRGWHFGLRRAQPRTLRWLPALVAAFYLFAFLYSVVVSPSGEQSIAEDLGADESDLQLVLTALLVVGVAPFAEEFFYRGLLFGALRRRLSFLPAAGIAGALFGAIHYSAPETLALLPLLAVLGFAFCLLYERTGSLWPAIAFHALNNAVAFPAAVDTDHAALVSAAIGLPVIAIALVLAVRAPAAPHPLAPSGVALGRRG